MRAWWTSHGLPVVDDSFFVAFNTGWEPRRFRVPNAGRAAAWRMIMDTAAARPFPARGRRIRAGGSVTVDRRAVVLLRGLEA